MKLGCHVGMSGKEMMLGSVKEALSYGANTFMLYTGAPQNTRRKDISELRIEEAKALMKEQGMDEFVVHAPYIINLANCVKPETYQIAVEFLEVELQRTCWGRCRCRNGPDREGTEFRTHKRYQRTHCVRDNGW